MLEKMKRYYVFWWVLPAQIVMTVIWIVNLRQNGWVACLAGGAFALFSLALDYVIFRFFETVRGRVQLEEEIAQLYTIREKELNYATIADAHVRDVEQLGAELEEKVDSSLEILRTAGEEKEDRDEAEQILRGMEEIVRKRKFVHYCDNSMVNALLDAKVQAAKEQGLELEAHCRIPQKTHLDEYELCGLFENMLNAAFEINRKYCRDIDRLRIKAEERAGKMVVRVEWEIGNSGMLAAAESGKRNALWGRDPLEKRLWCAKLTLVDKICQKGMGKVSVRREGNILALVAIV